MFKIVFGENMNKIVLLSCVSKKKSFATRAEELYESSFFKYALKYAKKQEPDHIFILSALHGLVELNQILAPYNVTLNNMSTKDRKQWTSQVFIQMQNKKVDLSHDHFIILAGEKYRQYLLPFMKNYSIPMQGLPIGKQLQFLKNEVQE